jgi:hypothetical protein
VVLDDGDDAALGEEAESHREILGERARAGREDDDPEELVAKERAGGHETGDGRWTGGDGAGDPRWPHAGEVGGEPRLRRGSAHVVRIHACRSTSRPYRCYHSVVSSGVVAGFIPTRSHVRT